MTTEPKAPKGAVVTQSDSVAGTLAFFASCIRGGEKWDDVCQSAYDKAMASLSTRAPQQSPSADGMEVIEAATAWIRVTDAQPLDVDICFDAERRLRFAVHALKQETPAPRQADKLVRWRDSFLSHYDEGTVAHVKACYAELSRVQALLQAAEDRAERLQGERDMFKSDRDTIGASRLAIAAERDAEALQSGRLRSAIERWVKVSRPKVYLGDPGENADAWEQIQKALSLSPGDEGEK